MKLNRRERRRRKGSALIPALMVASLMAMLGLSMLQATLNGSRVVNFQGDEYRLKSAVESVGIVATDRIWSQYLAAQGGAAGSINSFRAYLDGAGIADAGPGGPPPADAGLDFLEIAGVPGAGVGNPEFDDVNIDALRVVRRDAGESTQLYVTVSASTNRGKDIVNPVLNRAIQLVYTIEPAQFDGFDYGVLTNNVNCIFCHSVVDSADRYYNLDAGAHGTFDRVKVGTLESLMIRDNMDGRPDIGDWDADSYIAGSLYMRGKLTNHDGVPITSGWNEKSFKSFAFDGDGHLVEDAWGDLQSTPFAPNSDPHATGENIYLDYPTQYSEMPDGVLPTSFPPPFPDNGGTNPATGLADTSGAGNKRVDPFEFYQASQEAEGAIVAGIINVSDPSFVIDQPAEYSAALFTGNQPSLGSATSGNVILTGTPENPIVIDGTIAIDGDLVINGYVKGQGSILVSGNIYIPTDLKYLDGQAYLPGDGEGSPSGPRTFGIAQDGTKNALGLAAGGNMLLGDYLKPSVFTAPGQYEYIDGTPNSDWNFSLAELSLFNRTEWAKTQPLLPGAGDDQHDPSTWSVPNPSYAGVDYVPRYYNFGPGDEIPIYNLGDIHFDAASGTWRGDEEVPLSWDEDKLTIWDPSDTSNAALYDPSTGAAKAAILQLTPKDGWLSDYMQKLAIEYFETQHAYDTPMQIDGLLYTNNAIFGIVHRGDRMKGQLQINGALVCPDLGVLAPGRKNTAGYGTGDNPPDSPYKVGLRLNYDRRVKGMLNVTNPNQVTIKRTLWNPTANML
ncbi:MAG: hypothetical protein H6828_00715 [Planctomycetes bacterium]|nr:hypothetical protein [Planctomycetota bacterium]